MNFLGGFAAGWGGEGGGSFMLVSVLLLVWPGFVAG